MKKFILINKWLIIIFSVALFVRIFSFVSLKPWDSNTMQVLMEKGDSREYHNLAQQIVEKNSYPENIYLDTYRTPVYPLYVAIFYYLFGVKQFIILISQIILSLISVIFVYLLCEKIFNNKKISLLASLLYALEPNVVKLVTEFGTETLHATLLIVSLYYLIAGLKNKKYYFISLSGFFFAITALTRPISLYFYILCVLFILFYPDEQRKVKFKYILFFIVFYLISITPWMYRNYKVYDYFSTNTFQGNTYIYLAGITKYYETGLPLDSVNYEFMNTLNRVCNEKNLKNPFEIDEQKKIIGFNYLISHLDVYIPLHLKGMLLFFIAPLNNKSYSILGKILLTSYFIIIYTLFISGIYGMIKEKKYFFPISFTVVIFYFSFLTGIIGRARYRLPTTVFYLIIGSYGIFYLLNKYKISKTKKNEKIC